MHELRLKKESLREVSDPSHEYGKIGSISAWHRLRRRTIVFIRTERNRRNSQKSSGQCKTGREDIVVDLHRGRWRGDSYRCR